MLDFFWTVLVCDYEKKIIVNVSLSTWGRKEPLGSYTASNTSEWLHSPGLRNGVQKHLKGRESASPESSHCRWTCDSEGVRWMSRNPWVSRCSLPSTLGQVTCLSLPHKQTSCTLAFPHTQGAFLMDFFT